MIGESMCCGYRALRSRRSRDARCGQALRLARWLRLTWALLRALPRLLARLGAGAGADEQQAGALVAAGAALELAVGRVRAAAAEGAGTRQEYSWLGADAHIISGCLRDASAFTMKCSGSRCVHGPMLVSVYGLRIL